MEKLNVFFQENIVGFLKVDDNQIWEFQYSPQWLSFKNRFPISISLPLQENRFSHKLSLSFFSNLLPEGDVRAQVANYFNISQDNSYALLKAIGGDCAGALIILPDGESLDLHNDYRVISLDEMDDMIQNLNTKPILVADGHVRLSLAGAQQKIPVFYKDEKIMLPLRNSISTHILKPINLRFPGLIENEFFCMKLAKSIGLDVPEACLLNIKNINALLIDRYDRVFINGKWSRLHQEDFCQALGIASYNKYQSEGGPGIKECVSLGKEFSGNSISDVKRLINWICFNSIIGNADAHAKNISFLYDAKGIKIAPFYDLVSTIFYSGLSKSLAMKIGGAKKIDNIYNKNWVSLAESIDLKADLVLRLKNEMIDMVLREGNKLKKEFAGVSTINDIYKLIEKNTLRLARE
ncbi:MAG: type II toxin-antitoxin system HipA family toxin [Candidatus Omnitrophica bacterium]|nr:type II toxin-antitoxin system HipA family toxin [Candidatus Omnitrophota bacterium]